ncbi:DUF6714 family protein [Neolewinella agarilytica]|uniref:DUF6714 family protein n=1 Tax=Neolewinella agarilytica TaxID=478744 RepID=UPI002355E9DC|nr:DUF6714 family protein [Neolewinella agarilytica]
MPLTSLEQQIHDAFIDAPFPADGYDIYAGQTDDDYGQPNFTTEHLPGRRWHEISPEQLLDCQSAFSYLRPDGWRHYLPAALMLEINQPYSNINVIWLLREGDDFAKQRQASLHATLDAGQGAAVIAFLEYYIARERNIHATHAHHRYAQAGMEWTEELEPARLEDAEATLEYWRGRLADG